MNTPRLFVSACALLVLASSACGDDSSSSGSGGGGTGGAGSGGNDVEAPASCSIIAGLVGNYAVTGEPTGDEGRGAITAAHQRQSIAVASSFDVDFDTGIAFDATEITDCYDRRNQDFDRRIQVSYGADDDGPVINFYMATGDVVDEIQYRDRNQSINMRVLVQKD
jgi:hypothetical protein